MPNAAADLPIQQPFTPSFPTEYPAWYGNAPPSNISLSLPTTPSRPDDEPPRVAGALSPIQTTLPFQRWIGL